MGLSNILSNNGFYACSRHNYTGLNMPCPDCHSVEAGGIASYEASDLEELRKEFYEKFTGKDVDVFNGGYKIEFYSNPDLVWLWIEEKLEAR